MSSFTTLLLRAWQRVNAVGKTLALGVGLFGIALIVVQALLAFQVGTGLLRELRSTVGEERFAVLQQQMGSEVTQGNDIEKISQTFFDEISASMQDMSDEQKSAFLLQILLRVVRASLLGIVTMAGVLLLLQALARAYFQILTTLRPQTFTASLTLTARFFLPLLGAWIGVVLCGGLWLPAAVFILGFVSPTVLNFSIPSLLLPIILLPRFLFAPFILLQEKKRIRASLHESYRRTQGKWWHVVKNIVGASVVVWIALSVAQSILQLLVQSLLPYSVLGFSLYALVPFIALIGAAYRSAFTVELKEEVAR